MRIPISNLDDPRVAPFRQLKASNVSRHGTWFIAEGTKVVDRLLTSDYETVSVMLSEKQEQSWLPKVPEHIPVYILPEALGSLVVGFNFHVGVVACGRRRKSPQLEDVLPHTANKLTIVVCPNCDNPENLGAIIRISRALGVDLVLLGTSCCDPFSRRVLRVSMGTAFKQPVIESNDLTRDLMRLKTEWDVELVATVLDPLADPLAHRSRPARIALLFGNEAHGLTPQWINLCDQKVMIPMSGDTDSLNVAVAAGIFLHHFTRNV